MLATLAYCDAVISNPLQSHPVSADCDAQRLAQACQAAPGHFDELRGHTIAPGTSASTGTDQRQAGLSPSWDAFMRSVPGIGAVEFNQRATSLERQIRDNGVTYNVYADENGPHRPWSLDLFPLLIEPASWQQIERGVLQRVRLLEGMMRDVYGPKRLLQQGLLPSALVQGHPGYLRALHGVPAVGGTHLHVVAFDLARGPDGNWWVVAQRSQAPSGLGYLLENRLAVSGQFAQAFESLRVQRLAGTYRALMDGLKRACPQREQAHIALLTPGRYNETYFEHAYLARYLGLSLVEGSDLTVRDQHLFLRTLKGLVPVHGLLRRVDDAYLDPLELRPDSTLGVPGLLQVIRAGNVLVANTPGAAFLESPALLGFLPGIARALLDEALLMPSLHTWWCGERSAMEQALTQLHSCAIKPTYPGAPLAANFDAALGHALSARELDDWAQRIVRQADEHTLQAYVPLSQMPTWQRADPARADLGHMQPRSVMLRVFAVADGVQSWRVLPGGLARVASGVAELASMQRGGSSADVWALTPGEVDPTTLLPKVATASSLSQRQKRVTSRAAENLFWLGRYTERTENAARLAQLCLDGLNGEAQTSMPLLDWLAQMARSNGLVAPPTVPPSSGRRVFERTLIAQLAAAPGSSSVGYSLAALKSSASTVRERLSQEHWHIIVRAEDEFNQGARALAAQTDYSVLEAQRLLKIGCDHLAAITGAQTDRMMRDDGWRLLSIGRHIERLGFLAAALALGFETNSVHTEAGFDAMLVLFDSSITFRAQYQQRHDLAALVDLLVLDRDNPRSLAWVAHTLRGRLARLAGAEPDQLSSLALRVPQLSHWRLPQLFDEPDAQAAPTQHAALREVLALCVSTARELSDEISATYFTHCSDEKQSLGIQ